MIHISEANIVQLIWHLFQNKGKGFLAFSLFRCINSHHKMQVFCLENYLCLFEVYFEDAFMIEQTRAMNCKGVSVIYWEIIQQLTFICKIKCTKI